MSSAGNCFWFWELHDLQIVKLGRGEGRWLSECFDLNVNKKIDLMLDGSGWG